MRNFRLLLLCSVLVLAASPTSPARAGGTWGWNREEPAPKPAPFDWWTILWPFKF
jgi:hypothetical protein